MLSIKKHFLIIALLALIIIAHLSIFSKLIYFPYPELFIYPYLTNNGLVPYSQILDQHFPGLMFFPINFDYLGMRTPEIAKIWSMGIIIITHILLFLVGKGLIKNNFKVLVVNILYLVWQPFFEGWVLWIDNFLPLFLLPAFYFCFQYFFNKGRYRNLFLGGLFLGIAVVFKQTVIPLSLLMLIYVLFYTRKINLVSIFTVGLLSPILLMILYFLTLGILKDFLYWTIIFNLTTYATYGTRLVPMLGFITRILFVYLFSIFALKAKEKPPIFLLFIFLIGSLMGVLDRLDFVHFQPSLPFVLLATMVGFHSIRSRHIILLLVYFSVTVWWLIIFYSGHISNKVLLFGEHEYKLAKRVEQLTAQKEKIFVLGEVPHLYQMSNTLPSGDIYVFQFPWFLRVNEDRILEKLKQNPPRLAVLKRDAIIEKIDIKIFASKIYDFIDKNYTTIDKVDDTDLLMRK